MSEENVHASRQAMHEAPGDPILLATLPPSQQQRRLAFAIIAVFLVLYGAGNGIGTVARGALPLMVFGADRYPVLVGRLALPILIAMAVSPYLGGLAFQRGGADWTFAILVGLGIVNVALAVTLRLLIARRA